MMFTQRHLHGLAIFLLAVFILIFATKELIFLQKTVAIAGIIIGSAVLWYSLKRLDIIK